MTIELRDILERRKHPQSYDNHITGLVYRETRGYILRDANNARIKKVQTEQSVLQCRWLKQVVSLKKSYKHLRLTARNNEKKKIHIGRNRYILVVSDYCSKWTESYPMPNMEARTVAKIVVEEFIVR